MRPRCTPITRLGLVTTTALLFATTTTNNKNNNMLVQAQLIPGIDNKPQNPTDAVDICAQATNLLLADPDLAKEFQLLSSQYLPTALMGGCTNPQPSELVCNVDLEPFDLPIQDICKSLGGDYSKRQQVVACSNGQGTTVWYKVAGYPACFAPVCEASTVERFQSRQVEMLEQEISKDLGLVCLSDYDITDDDDIDGNEADSASRIVSHGGGWVLGLSTTMVMLVFGDWQI